MVSPSQSAGHTNSIYEVCMTMMPVPTKHFFSMILLQQEKNSF